MFTFVYINVYIETHLKRKKIRKYKHNRQNSKVYIEQNDESITKQRKGIEKIYKLFIIMFIKIKSQFATEA